jgi:bacteriocin resistance YdeI/OmpD-like protein/uncharacterized protein DUF1905
MKFATQIPHGEGRAGLIELPFDVRAEYGQARPPVRGTVNGYPFRTTVAVYGGKSYIGFRREIRDGAGIAPGDAVEIELERDDAPREVAVPDDLAAALACEPGLREAFDGMSFTHRREYVEAIEEAKRPETRARRVQLALDAARARAGS